MDKMITPLYKFIIFLEEKGSINGDEISSLSKNSLRGIMGKMEAMKLIKKDDGLMSLSDRGYVFLNSILDAIHKPTEHWDGKWRVVYFTTPENIRSRRDKFRRDIESFGFRPILKGLWFSPMPAKTCFDKMVAENQMQNMAVFLETGGIETITEEMVAKAWDFDKNRKKYENFINKADVFLKNGTRDRIVAKELIFEYALVLNGEPRLPIEFLPKDWPKYRAKLMYKKLKNLLSR